MANREGGRGGGGRGNNQPAPTLDQQAFMEAIGAVTVALMRASVIAATIAQVGAIGNQGGLSNIQRSEASFPSALEGRGDPVVTGHCSRLFRKDVGTSSKRNESQSSSSSKDRDKAAATRAKARISLPKMGDISRLLASQSRERVSSATGLDTLDEIALRGKDPRVIGHHNPNHQWDMHRHGLFLLTPSMGQGNRYQS